uniref:Uncharacterized protein n=1 Tax=Chromera velia CCMP2878 TaxID=1169474 RepID=A0A0G4HZA3_9ALVE|eukprot:Cvel_9687.t1-p1 / transcript=Cvel_9687.t1 / gene=Cvel_9687 / organism=Chromera_velia_CCMP2878 / gene_product=hypothetical protein / transcript_product=hypothetical protein / location=Cvel_scaffold564:51872-56544(-) / protein_length=1430 / sequence_SO=supercontig / SO=protein_coding / is_pseudo=false
MHNSPSSPSVSSPQPPFVVVLASQHSVREKILIPMLGGKRSLLFRLISRDLAAAIEGRLTTSDIIFESRSLISWAKPSRMNFEKTEADIKYECNRILWKCRKAEIKKASKGELYLHRSADEVFPCSSLQYLLCHAAQKSTPEIVSHLLSFLPPLWKLTLSFPPCPPEFEEEDRQGLWRFLFHCPKTSSTNEFGFDFHRTPSLFWKVACTRSLGEGMLCAALVGANVGVLRLILEREPELLEIMKQADERNMRVRPWYFPVYPAPPRYLWQVSRTSWSVLLQAAIRSEVDPSRSVAWLYTSMGAPLSSSSSGGLDLFLAEDGTWLREWGPLQPRMLRYLVRLGALGKDRMLAHFARFGCLAELKEEEQKLLRRWNEKRMWAMEEDLYEEPPAATQEEEEEGVPDVPNDGGQQEGEVQGDMEGEGEGGNMGNGNGAVAHAVPLPDANAGEGSAAVGGQSTTDAGAVAQEEGSGQGEGFHVVPEESSVPSSFSSVAAVAVPVASSSPLSSTTSTVNAQPEGAGSTGAEGHEGEGGAPLAEGLLSLPFSLEQHDDEAEGRESAASFSSSGGERIMSPQVGPDGDGGVDRDGESEEAFVSGESEQGEGAVEGLSEGERSEEAEQAAPAPTGELRWVFWAPQPEASWWGLLAPMGWGGLGVGGGGQGAENEGPEGHNGQAAFGEEGVDMEEGGEEVEEGGMDDEAGGVEDEQEELDGGGGELENGEGGVENEQGNWVNQQGFFEGIPEEWMGPLGIIEDEDELDHFGELHDEHVWIGLSWHFDGVCRAAAETGQLAVLRWARLELDDWEKEDEGRGVGGMGVADQGPHRFYRERKFPWSPQDAVTALHNGHFDVFRAMVSDESSDPLPILDEAFIVAVERGKLEWLKCMKKWDRRTGSELAETLPLTVLEASIRCCNIEVVEWVLCTAPSLVRRLPAGFFVWPLKGIPALPPNPNLIDEDEEDRSVLRESRVFSLNEALQAAQILKMLLNRTTPPASLLHSLAVGRSVLVLDAFRPREEQARDREERDAVDRAAASVVDEIGRRHPNLTPPQHAVSRAVQSMSYHVFLALRRLPRCTPSGWRSPDLFCDLVISQQLFFDPCDLKRPSGKWDKEVLAMKLRTKFGEAASLLSVVLGEMGREYLEWAGVLDSRFDLSKNSPDGRIPPFPPFSQRCHLMNSVASLLNSLWRARRALEKKKNIQDVPKAAVRVARAEIAKAMHACVSFAAPAQKMWSHSIHPLQLPRAGLHLMRGDAEYSLMFRDFQQTPYRPNFMAGDFFPFRSWGFGDLCGHMDFDQALFRLVRELAEDFHTQRQSTAAAGGQEVAEAESKPAEEQKGGEGAQQQPDEASRPVATRREQGGGKGSSGKDGRKDKQREAGSEAPQCSVLSVPEERIRQTRDEENAMLEKILQALPKPAEKTVCGVSYRPRSSSCPPSFR